MSQFEKCLAPYGEGSDVCGEELLKARYNAVSTAVMQQIQPLWQAPKSGKTACYLSAEFLIGRMIYANLYNLGRLEELRSVFEQHGLDAAMFEDVDDAALGNGGLGRLAACFLDSGATMGLKLDGYGIRYRYGLFAQSFANGFQHEEADDWQRFGDPWSVRREEEKVQVSFGGQQVWAVPYDMPIIGYGGTTINTLRLWQAEAPRPFDFAAFNNGDFETSYAEGNSAEAIHSVLYPNDESIAGKRLRLKQQYFFSSASLQCILRRFKQQHGTNFAQLPQAYAIQLNDTHPTVAIPELLRLLMQQEQLLFEDAFAIVRSTFAYTNHTLMAEALEKWDVNLFATVLPEVYPYVVLLNNALMRELTAKGITGPAAEIYSIVQGGQVHMARMAIYATHSTNGVAAIHSELLKSHALKEWYALYPQRFNNKTNGITQRRWLGLCNPELSAYITRRIGDGWITKLDELKGLERYAQDDAALAELAAIKAVKKQQLVAYIARKEGVQLNEHSVFDIHIKRMHEYKRQLLNAFSILDIYFQMKEGKLQDLPPVTMLFGGKAAPGYRRAKGVIKYINEIARMIQADPDVRDRLQVLFVQNYNVSYAEKLIPAADISEQISTAGTEASGTGNMKFMLNGAVTLGTYDGANIEIVQAAGEENNFIFGARVEDLQTMAAYNPMGIYRSQPRIKRVLDTLIDGTFDDGGSGQFAELYRSLLQGATWHKPDHYFLLLDLIPYVDAKLAAYGDYGRDHTMFTRKCLWNIANAGRFSSDRTIAEYARDIWGLEAN